MSKKDERPFLVTWGTYDERNHDSVYVYENMEEVLACSASDAVEKASIPRGMDWIESLLIDRYVRKMIEEKKKEAEDETYRDGDRSK